jgi:hypothetical protein
MKVRSSIILMSLLVLLVLVLSQGQARPQQKTIPADKPTAARPNLPLQWENVDGVQVMRVWEVEGKEVWPQIAVLRVSNAQYLKFSRKPEELKEFLNKHKVFSIDVIVVTPWKSPRSLNPKDDLSDWVLLAVHKPMSTVLFAALRQWDSGSPQPKPK